MKSKKEDQLNELYKPQTFEVKTAPQQECELTSLEKQNKKISVKFSDEKIEKQGLLSRSKFSCTITCEELSSNVTRTLEDFEWLKDQLHEKYPLIFIPPLPPKEKSDDPKIKSRYLEKFFNVIIRKKILRTSPIIQEFLMLDDKNFNIYKKCLNDNKFNLLLTMENFKSNKPQLKYDFKKEQIYLPEKYIKKLEPTKNMYNSLVQAINQVANDFANLEKHMKEIGDLFGNLNKSAKDTDQSDLTKKVFEKLKTIFSSWSVSYQKQKEFFDQDFKEIFKYINLELNELNVIHNQYMKYRNNYETLGIELINKKEKLFNEKKYNKWELSKEDESKLDDFKDNHDEAMKYICKEFSEVVTAQKIEVACSCNIVMKEFRHVNKYIGEQLKKYFESLKERNQTIVGDAFNVVKLFNVQIESEN